MIARKALLAVALITLPGCSLYNHYLGEPTPQPVTIPVSYRSPTVDGHRIRRVAVLPFRDDTEHPEHAGGVQRAFVDAMNRRQVFEVVEVGLDELDAREEREFFRNGRVARDTLMRLASAYNADGVLYGVVTRYRAYEPMAIGLRISLVSAGAGDLVWEANGLFDSADARVVQDVHHWYDTEVDRSDHLERWRSVLMSPTRFSSYACSRIVTTW